MRVENIFLKLHFHFEREFFTARRMHTRNMAVQQKNEYIFAMQRPINILHMCVSFMPKKVCTHFPISHFSAHNASMNSAFAYEKRERAEKINASLNFHEFIGFYF